MGKAITETISFTSPAAAGTSESAAIPLTHNAGTILVVLAKLVGATGGTLDIYLQETWDVDAEGEPTSSAEWRDVCHFTQLAAGASAINYRFTVPGDLTVQTVGVGTTASPGVVLAAGKVCGSPWGPLIRAVAVAGASTSAGAAVVIKISQQFANSEG